MLIAVDDRDLIDNTKLKATMKVLNGLFANGEAQITLCTTTGLEPVSLGDNHMAEQLYQLRRNVIEQSLTECGNCFGENIKVSTAVLGGKAFVSIIRRIVADGYDALVYVRHHGLASSGLSATEMHLARKCPSPILFFEAQESNKLENIVVAVDRDIYGRENPSTLAQELIRTATKIADVQGSKLHIVHAWEPFGVDLLGDPRLGFDSHDIDNYRSEQRASHDIWLKELTASSAGPATANDITTTLHLKQGVPEDVIADVCANVDAGLLIIGTVGITDVPGVLIGNTAETILGNAPCSTLTLKPSGFKTPVEF